jgi:hypothetical protein
MRCDASAAAPPNVVHVAGAIASSDDQIRWTRIRRPVLELQPPCCKCGAENVQITTSLVVTLTQSQGGAVEVQERPPSARDPRTLRHCPYIKQRYNTCEPVVRSLFSDVGRSVVMPWHSAGVSILVPETVSSDGGQTVNVPAGWLVDPRPGDEILSPIAGAFQAWDVWIWVTLRCTDCEPSDAILTDSAIANQSAGNSPLFVVPPGADELQIVAGEAAATVHALWVVSDGTVVNSRVVGQSALGNAAFGNQEPRCVCVPPLSTHLNVTTAPTDIPIALAWRIRP